MDISEINNKLNGIFIDVLDNPSIMLKNDTTAKDIDEWDSLTNVQLIVAIEKFFKIRFTAPEIQQFKNVGDICQRIHSKLA